MAKKYIEGFICFYIGLLLISVLSYASQFLNFYFGKATAPEVGMTILVFFLFMLAIVYYGIMLLVQKALSISLKSILDPVYLFPLAFMTGGIVGLIYLSELDLFSFLFYQQNHGVSFITTGLVEILFLLITFVIIKYVENRESMSKKNVHLLILLLLTLFTLLTLDFPFSLL
jgi:hypothetical protein